MKKILMGSFVLTAISLSIIAFQFSCSKSANAQQVTNNCSEMATLTFDVKLPSEFQRSPISYRENGIYLDGKQINDTTGKYIGYMSYYLTYPSDGDLFSKKIIFKKIIPGQYEYYSYIVNVDSTKFRSTGRKSINIVAGQNYNLTIYSTDFR